MSRTFAAKKVTEEDPPIVFRSASSVPTDEPLCVLCGRVVACDSAYSDVAESIENSAYSQWKCGRVRQAVEELRRVACFFEELENKNEENIGDLASVYLLIGQLYQYDEKYPASIEWFSKSIFVDDGNVLPYHCMGVSYLRTGNVRDAIRSFEQELAIDGGNYDTYLQLAALYGQTEKPEQAEECLKALLTRDKENIQGLHALIRHYEKQDAAIDTRLLRKRLLGVRKRCNVTEAVIRAWYLCADKRHVEALASLDAAARDNHAFPVFLLVKAYIFGHLKIAGNRKKEIDGFVTVCQALANVMEEHLHIFAAFFGEPAARRLKRSLEKRCLF